MRWIYCASLFVALMCVPSFAHARDRVVPAHAQLNSDSPDVFLLGGIAGFAIGSAASTGGLAMIIDAGNSDGLRVGGGLLIGLGVLIVLVGSFVLTCHVAWENRSDNGGGTRRFARDQWTRITDRKGATSFTLWSF